MRRGCTVREVMVAMASLTVLGLLGLTAVQKMRDAAARQHCQNNLKQHGLACQNHVSSNNDRLPPGTMPNAALPPEQRLSFHVALNPYIESSPLYKLIAKEEAWDSPANVRTTTKYGSRGYYCAAWPGQGPFTGHLAITNYVGVAGVGAGAATRPAAAPGNGIFGYDRAVTVADVKDGLENTALILETGHHLGPWLRGGPSTVRAVGVDDAQFGGTHRSGFNVLLADGSVRFTKADIAPAILAALATINGNEEIPTGW